MKRTALCAALAAALALPCAALPLGLRLAARAAAANAQSRAETEEERAYRIYAPNTASEFTVTNGATVSVSFSRLSGHASVTVDWGDGTTSVHTDSPATHTYAADGAYVVQTSDDISTYGILTIGFCTAHLRWGDSVTSVSWAFSMLWVAKENNNIKGFVPRWNDKITNVSYTYYGCTGLTGAVPAWGAAIQNAESTYSGCKGLSGAVPAWGAAIQNADSTYSGCSGLTGAWTDDPAELMPTNITSHANTVWDASAALRALFYSDWGGTRTKPADE